jgi:hypothetical protein
MYILFPRDKNGQIPGRGWMGFAVEPVSGFFIMDYVIFLFDSVSTRDILLPNGRIDAHKSQLHLYNNHSGLFFPWEQASKNHSAYWKHDLAILPAYWKHDLVILP